MEEKEKDCKKKIHDVFKDQWGWNQPPWAQQDCLRLFLVHPSGSTDGMNIQVSYHVWTSDVLTHLQSDQIGLLKADAAVDQQERPHEAEDKKKKILWTQRHLLVNWRMLSVPPVEDAHFVRVLRYGSTISTKSLGALCPYPGMSTRVKAPPTRKKFIFFVWPWGRKTHGKTQQGWGSALTNE